MKYPSVQITDWMTYSSGVTTIDIRPHFSPKKWQNFEQFRHCCYFEWTQDCSVKKIISEPKIVTNLSRKKLIFCLVIWEKRVCDFLTRTFFILQLQNLYSNEIINLLWHYINIGDRCWRFLWLVSLVSSCSVYMSETLVGSVALLDI